MQLFKKPYRLHTISPWCLILSICFHIPLNNVCVLNRVHSTLYEWSNNRTTGAAVHIPMCVWMLVGKSMWPRSSETRGVRFDLGADDEQLTSYRYYGHHPRASLDDDATGRVRGGYYKWRHRKMILQGFWSGRGARKGTKWNVVAI